MKPPQRVLVLRALMLGDMLCATPALRALRHALPDAHIALAGLPWAREWAGRLRSVDEFIDFPGWPGMPERPDADLRSLRQFLQQLRQRRFDLALQWHGSGAIVNRLLAQTGATQLAGFADAAAWRPASQAGRFIDWPQQGSEIERLLALTDHLGWPRQGTGLDFPLQDEDRRAADRLCRRLRGAPIVVVHPGARFASRRWPATRFAAVADALAAQGFAVVLTGSPGEAPLTAAVAGQMRAPAADLAGRTTLGALGALVQRARLLLCNDTGISHVAAALGTPSVVVSCGSDAARWLPLDTRLHRGLWHDVPCRPCMHVDCPLGHPCALGVQVAEVRRAARSVLLQAARPSAGAWAPCG